MTIRLCLLPAIFLLGLALLAGARSRAAAEPPDGKRVTYSSQVARILQARCQACHRAEGVAPFALTSYDQARRWAPTMRAVVAARRMPPWHADPRHGKFLNDRSLPQAEIDTLVAWADAGAPEGDPRDVPAPAAFPKSWSIGQPDRVIEMPKAFEVPAEGVLPYQDFVVDPGFKEDVWVERAEAKPGCRAVHHILVYALAPGRPKYDLAGNTTVVCGTAPGDMPLILQPGQAKRIPAGAKLLFEVHYTPNGKVERDRSSIGLVFAKAAPKQEVRTNILVKMDIRVPAGASSHREEQTFSFPKPVRILSLMPHMHVRGKAWEYRLIHPDGRAETLLSVPRYDFNWQSVYRFAVPPRIERGAKLQCIAWWDNSPGNPVNPDPKKEITWGLQTWDEMMNGWADYVEEE